MDSINLADLPLVRPSSLVMERTKYSLVRVMNCRSDRERLSDIKGECLYQDESYFQIFILSRDNRVKRKKDIYHTLRSLYIRGNFILKESLS